jgi:hypothetical protein
MSPIFTFLFQADSTLYCLLITTGGLKLYDVWQIQSGKIVLVSGLHDTLDSGSWACILFGWEDARLSGFLKMLGRQTQEAWGFLKGQNSIQSGKWVCLCLGCCTFRGLWSNWVNI